MQISQPLVLLSGRSQSYLLPRNWGGGLQTFLGGLAADATLAAGGLSILAMFAPWKGEAESSTKGSLQGREQPSFYRVKVAYLRKEVSSEFGNNSKKTFYELVNIGKGHLFCCYSSSA